MQAQPPATAAGAGWRDLKLRVLASLVLIPAALGAAWAGGIWFELLLAAAGLLMAWEWCALAHQGSRWQAALHGFAALSAAFMTLHLSVPVALIAILAAWLLSGLTLLREGKFGRFWRWAGVPYVSLPILALVLLRSDPLHGLMAVVWVFAVVWSADIGAYFAGRLIGGPKLWPSVSPSKTWAGLAGAAAAGALAGALLGLVDGLPSPAALALLGAVLGIVEQGGDLFESAAKRSYGVKDSGAIIPGHGGVLDRVDGLAFAAVAAALLGAARADSGHIGQGLLLW